MLKSLKKFDFFRDEMINSLQKMIDSKEPLVYLIKNNEKFISLIEDMNSYRKTLNPGFDFIEVGLYDEACKQHKSIISNYETMISNSNEMLKKILILQMSLTKNNPDNLTLITEVLNDGSTEYYTSKLDEIKTWISLRNDKELLDFVNTFKN